MTSERNPNPDHMGTALRAVRTGVGMSLQEVADASGVSKNHLWNVERGDRVLSPDLLRRVLLAVVERITHRGEAA